MDGMEITQFTYFQQVYFVAQIELLLLLHREKSGREEKYSKW